MGTYDINPIYVAITTQDQDHSKHQLILKNNHYRLLYDTVGHKNCLCKSLNCNGLKIPRDLSVYNSIDTL